VVRLVVEHLGDLRSRWRSSSLSTGGRRPGGGRQSRAMPAALIVGATGRSPCCPWTRRSPSCKSGLPRRPFRSRSDRSRRRPGKSSRPHRLWRRRTGIRRCRWRIRRRPPHSSA